MVSRNVLQQTISTRVKLNQMEKKFLWIGLVLGSMSAVPLQQGLVTKHIRKGHPHVSA